MRGLILVVDYTTGFSCPPTVHVRFITKCDKCHYKELQIFFLLQSVTSVITKCDRYYKVGRLLQSATEQTYIVY